MLDHEPDFEHLARPTLSTQLRAYENTRQDRIREAFEPGNYRSLLRVDNRPHTARDGRVMVRSPRRLPKLRTERPTSVVTGLFRAFPYLQDRYDKPELRKAVRDKHRSFVEGIGQGQEFVCRSPRGVARPKWKGDPGRTNDPIKHITRSETKKDGDSRTAFRPSGGGHDHCPWRNHSLLREVMEKLHKLIDADWSSLNVDIYSDAEDLVVVEFRKPSKEERVGLLSYMNLIAQGSDIVVQHGLVKLVERWDFVAGETIYYTFQPPWVQSKSGEAFFRLHPSYRSWKLLLARKQRQSLALSRPRSGRV